MGHHPRNEGPVTVHTTVEMEGLMANLEAAQIDALAVRAYLAA
ncbi:hypothetical protein PACID_07200 [Acidipropionibacterium acidipropionici ATCC 4875]|uniref:Uncharacterized protein n=1 Tax=Acidipropionibacterium acidipropionici (strain ATCC 4875 / DSM 20272 / JCM 6432 / NBRC 12425 / NCIMB 8070 / 4) TaxID=1171373 RepID=K7RUE1_ACIA4|nr:hypothetical protein PACID_07200 [Acidipropionibacterium acidipropionici ATCC 4875]